MRHLPILLALSLAACGGASSDEPDAPSGTPASRAPAADASEPRSPERAARRPGRGGAARAAATVRALADPATAGTLLGVVRLEGEAPERVPMTGVAKTAGCLHDGALEPPLSETVIATDGRLANVFVHVRRGLPRDWEAPPPAEAVVHLDQEGCMYRPRVLGMRVGQTLEVLNSDPVTHNVNCQSQKNASFNRTQAPSGRPETWTPERPEVMTTFGCNIHPWMFAWVGVVEHPFFAVTGAGGDFRLEGLPPGEYELEAWHERYGRLRADAAVSADGGAEVTFVYRPEGR